MRFRGWDISESSYLSLGPMGFLLRYVYLRGHSSWPQACGQETFNWNLLTHKPVQSLVCRVFKRLKEKFYSTQLAHHFQVSFRNTSYGNLLLCSPRVHLGQAGQPLLEHLPDSTNEDRTCSARVLGLPTGYILFQSCICNIIFSTPNTPLNYLHHVQQGSFFT